MDPKSKSYTEVVWLRKHKEMQRQKAKGNTDSLSFSSDSPLYLKLTYENLTKSKFPIFLNRRIIYEPPLILVGSRWKDPMNTIPKSKTRSCLLLPSTTLFSHLLHFLFKPSLPTLFWLWVHPKRFRFQMGDLFFFFLLLLTALPESIFRKPAIYG